MDAVGIPPNPETVFMALINAATLAANAFWIALFCIWAGATVSFS